MKKITFSAMILALCCGLISAAVAQPAPAPEATCFESRKGASEVVKRDLQPGWPNVKCSPVTGAVLWWGDPFDGTVPMGDMPLLEKIPPGHAVVKPRSEKLALMPLCGVACHNGVGPKFNPPKLPTSKRRTMSASRPNTWRGFRSARRPRPSRRSNSTRSSPPPRTP